MSKRSSPMQSTPATNTIDVFVSGLPQAMDKTTLAGFAAQCNAVGAKILFKTKGTTKNGFVHFTCVESAQYFIQTFNGTDPFNSGITFVARFADGKNGEQKKIHFGRLSASITESDIYDMCHPYGNILSINYISENACCFVTFSRGDQAQACLSGLANAGFNLSLARTNKRSTSASASPVKKQRVAETPFPIAVSPPVATPVESFSPVTQVVGANGNVFTTVQIISTELIHAERLSGCVPCEFVLAY